VIYDSATSLRSFSHERQLVRVVCRCLCAVETTQTLDVPHAHDTLVTCVPLIVSALMEVGISGSPGVGPRLVAKALSAWVTSTRSPRTAAFAYESLRTVSQRLDVWNELRTICSAAQIGALKLVG
jgi:hypothetical protein